MTGETPAVNPDGDASTGPPYVIEYDRVGVVLRITTRGFWSTGTTLAFSAALLARAAAIRLRHARVAVFADLRLAPVQSREVAGGVSDLAAKAVEILAGPVAIVAASPLGKVQSERVLAAVPHCRVFLDLDEAEAWFEREWPAARRR